MANPIRSTVRLDDLVIGSTSKVALSDVTGRELIPKGTRITQAIIDEIRLDGVTLLQLAPRSEVVQAEPSNSSVAGLDGLESLRLRPYSPERVARLEQKFAACEALVDQLIESIQNGIPVYVRDAEHEVEGYVNELTEDPAPVIAGALAYQSDLTLARRCVQFSVLSMAIGMCQKLNFAELQDVGLGALMHDWSLFSLAPEARFPQLPMPDNLRQEYAMHPLASESLLKKIAGTSEVQRAIVAQVHELLDGTGFPRGISGRQMHPLARVVSVADGYLTLTSPPPGVARVIPCDAIAYMIAGASKGRFSPASVSALLEAATLYPIGSVLELSDTTRVRVIRSNATDYGYPIVQCLLEPDKVIDLRNSELFVTRPVPSAEYDETRLPDAYKELNSRLEPT